MNSRMHAFALPNDASASGPLSAASIGERDAMIWSSPNPSRLSVPARSNVRRSIRAIAANLGQRVGRGLDMQFYLKLEISNPKQISNLKSEILTSHGLAL